MGEVDARTYHSWARLAWGYGLPCAVVGCRTADRRPGSVKVIECCHVPGGGKGIAMKGHYTKTVFLCWRHHDELDQQLGARLFEERYALSVAGVEVGSLTAAAAETERQWQLREWGLAF